MSGTEWGKFREPLPLTFFEQPTQQLAKALLGCLLVKETPEGTASGYIVETEAYMGAEDRAAHSFGNRRTKRTEIMYASAGHVYTYTMHRHVLLNVVSGPENVPHAILIRAVEPFEGSALMELRRMGRKRREWTNGPGKLSEALGITREDYGRTFTERPLYIAEGFVPDQVMRGPRVGIENTGDARFYPWRFWIKGNPYVSAMRKTVQKG
ncbi:DNA-3-methyladenine glycosylase [Sporolactobacillus sp. CPB3-1]|uniref:Putative 3-methyladenine DNA glycosylase n=1 Tax=Sporolactobacillus mangiferae TaxID=2940498 RepID=A0ABT0MAM8_9BACL|nr:DNA-3-methyladenine glycosylase [Sporolactobacillus mangiferae]MCL1631390.1 DNA-3-methyladenine glycosylase [Sporolactobacillus mangiferae]